MGKWQNHIRIGVDKHKLLYCRAKHLTLMYLPMHVSNLSTPVYWSHSNTNEEK